MTRYPMVWLTTPAVLFSAGMPGGSGESPGPRPTAATRHDSRHGSGAGPLAGTGATVTAGRATCYSGAPSFGFSLTENAEVSAPELGVVDGTDRGADAVRETGQVGDEQLRARPVGREAVARVGQHERVREVVVRAVDQRDVAVVQRGRGVVDVQDPHGLGR